MPLDFIKALSKLDKPPSSHNWVRFVRPTGPETTKSILSFVAGAPKFTYHTGSVAVRDRFRLDISLETAVAITQRFGAPAGRQQNKELVEAFFEFDLTRKYPKSVCSEFERQWFRISRELLIPVAPLVVVRENGRFVPIFLCGWSQVDLDIEQRRLLMTVCEDAFLSLTDYQMSPAEFLFFPKLGKGKAAVRTPEVWHRGDYALLPPDELNEQVQKYLLAREEARGILLTAKADEDRRRERDRTQPTGDFDDDLFGKK